MSYQRIAISAGHGKYVRGASGIMDEVDEARRVVAKLADDLMDLGIEVTTYADDVSKTQSENLERIVDWHNGQTRDLDVSVHFNAYVETTKPMGTECLYVTQGDLADAISTNIHVVSGLLDRGAKYRDDLYVLNNTNMPAILIEVCFVDSSEDAEIYRAKFNEICLAIAQTLAPDQEIA